MADFKNKGPQNGFETLIRAIEELTDNTVDLSSVSDDADPAVLRRRDAIKASHEIALERTQRHHDYVKGLYQSRKVFQEKNFKSAVVDDFNRQAIKTAQSFCGTAFLTQTIKAAPALFLLQGGPGTGKSYICNCIANDMLNSKWKDVEICTYAQIKKAKMPSQTDTTYDTEQKSIMWDRFTNVDLLIIDGLCQGNEALTAFDRQILPELLRSRRSSELPLVITTSLLPSVIHTHLGDECFESIKEYSVMTAALFGSSRRQPISFAGASIN
ncbi:MAG: hypothetical protein ACI4UM_06085 [Succinivibrio sp.]